MAGAVSVGELVGLEVGLAAGLAVGLAGVWMMSPPPGTSVLRTRGS